MHSHYVVTGPQGVMKQTPLDQARKDARLLQAIRRNGWEAIPDGDE